jgi:hypothetical protein
MKKKTFITIFIAFHICFIAVKIDKQSRFIKLSYEKQRLETERQKLLAKKQELTNALYVLKKPASVKQFAKEKLAMEPLNLKRVKRMHTS